MDDSHWEGKKCEAFYARGEVSLLQQNISRGVFQITLTQNGTYLSEKYLELVDLVADFFEQL